MSYKYATVHKYYAVYGAFFIEEASDIDDKVSNRSKVPVNSHQHLLLGYKRPSCPSEINENEISKLQSLL